MGHDEMSHQRFVTASAGRGRASRVDAPSPATSANDGVGALLAWVGALVAVLAGAVALGATPALATPPLAGPDDLWAWLSAQGPLDAAFASLRVAVAAVAAYLLVVTLVAFALRLLHAGRLVTVLDALTLPLVRRLVQGALGVGFVGVTAVSSTTASATVARPVAHPAVATVPGAATVVQAADVDADPPTMERLDEAPPERAPAGEVTLVAGDHLWSTAERALAVAWGRTPSDAELAPYWARLVDANRDRLLDPANPDLVFPGQTVVVPAPPPSS